MNYEEIKQLARVEGQRVTDLIALAPQNDPFYTGTPNDWALGQWFAGLWQAFGYRDGVHIRRVHYQIVSQDPPVVLPNGKPYENTEECWGILNLASKAARYLQLVDPAAFNDRRNPEAAVFASHGRVDMYAYVSGSLYRSDVSFPGFPELPGYSLSGFQGEQAYHLEVWCEKSTMNDVFLPLCQRYGANLQTGLGELSITATLALVHRLQAAQKPARILYVSDFDPAGQSMPVAVSRKMEYFIRTFDLNLDVRVFPVVLTQEQVHTFQLPRTPIKETERRRGGFEERYGEGAVELDALEALYPGKLEDILSGYIECYYDTSLQERVEAVELDLRNTLAATRGEVLATYESEIAMLQEEHEGLRREFEAQMAGYGERLKFLWQAIRTDLREFMPDMSNYPVPEAGPAHEVGDGLYNSYRDYLRQIEAYKAFQGKLQLQ